MYYNGIHVCFTVCSISNN